MGQSFSHIVTYLAIGVFVGMHVMLSGSQRTNLASVTHSGMLSGGRSATAKYFIVGLMAFCLWVFAATTQVVGHGNARFGWNGCWQWISLTVLMIAMIEFLRSQKLSIGVTQLMISIAAGAAVYALYQYFVSMPEQRAAFAADPSPFMRELGVAPGTSAAMLLKNRINSTEPTATFALANSLAGFLVPWFVFVFGLLLSLFDRHYGGMPGSRDLDVSDARSTAGTEKANGDFERLRVALILLSVLLVGLALVIGLTKSRSGWLASIVGVAGVAVTHRLFRRFYPQGLFRSKAFWGVSVGLLATGSAVVYVLDPLILREAFKSLLYRVEYWRGAVGMLRENVLFGVGPLNFQQAYVSLKSVTASETPADPHNLFAETAVTGGLPLLCSLLFVIGVWLWNGVRDCANSGASEMTPGSGEHIGGPFASRVGVRFFAVGAALGAISILLLVYMLDQMSPREQRHELYSAVAAIGAAALVFGLLAYFARPVLGVAVWGSGHVSVIGFWAGVAGVVNLLAAGGWMQPGTMVSLCVLFALTFQSTVRAEQSKQATLFAGGGLVLIVLSAFGVYTTTIAPTIRATVARELYANQFADSVDHEQLLGILDADRWDPELASLVCDHSVKRFADTRRDERSRLAWGKVFERGTDELVRRDPRNWGAQRDIGQWRFSLASSMQPGADGRDQQLRKGADHYRRSAQLNPTSCEAQLQAAIAMAVVGELEKSAEHLAAAESIDRLTPHIDKKLAGVTVFLPTGLLAGAELDRREYRVVSSPGLVKAEPVVDWLRRTVPTGK